jgi:hypothetical protein
MSSAPGVLPGTVTCTDVIDATAPMDVVLRVKGPITNPKVTNLSEFDGNHWIRWVGQVPDGAELTLGSRNWNMTAEGMDRPQDRYLTFSGTRFMTIYPQPIGQPATRLQLTGSGGGPATQLVVETPSRFR